MMGLLPVLSAPSASFSRTSKCGCRISHQRTAVVATAKARRIVRSGNVPRRLRKRSGSSSDEDADEGEQADAPMATAGEQGREQLLSKRPCFTLKRALHAALVAKPLFPSP